jgi:Fe-S-cluster containining protein
VNTSYRCYQCGQCCKIDKYSSEEEFEIARKLLADKGIELKGSKLENGMILWERPCPALQMENGKSKCLIYAFRPYPCRQFLCGKNSKEDNKPWIGPYEFNMTYYNWLIENKEEFRNLKEQIEDKAADWGIQHGWKLHKIK